MCDRVSQRVREVRPGSVCICVCVCDDELMSSCCRLTRGCVRVNTTKLATVSTVLAVAIVFSGSVSQRVGVDPGGVTALMASAQ